MVFKLWSESNGRNHDGPPNCDKFSTITGLLNCVRPWGWNSSFGIDCGFKYGFLALSKNVLCALKLLTLNDPDDVAAQGNLGSLGFGFWT